MLPTIKIGDLDVTRLIIGGNPFSGNSHVNRAMNDEMESFFTMEQIKKTLFQCMENGINTVQMRGDVFISRLVREFRSEGGKMHWIAQTASEICSLEGNLNALLRFPVYAPDAIYLHGTTIDSLFKAKDFDEIKRRLSVVRKTGLPVGLGTHMPEVIDYCEENDLDVDFYMASVYNISKINRVSSAITGKEVKNEPFDLEDLPVMYKTIRAASKPCLAFKILGATRRCETQDTVRAAFIEAFENIKPTDGVVVGMYPKFVDQVTLNAKYTAEACAAVK